METSDVIVTNNEDEDKILLTRLVTSFIPLAEDRTAFICKNNVLPKTLEELNITYKTDFANNFQEVNTNIAIASAITAYARMHMMYFKLHESCYYTDTDSVFVDDSEPFKHLLGKELGLFKDELDGSVINEAEFLGIKQYGYWFTDKKGIKQEKSVFAGVARNSITFENVQKLQNGETLTIKGKDSFYKSLLNLAIKIDQHDLHITKNNNKTLINNFDYPIEVNNGERIYNNNKF